MNTHRRAARTLAGAVIACSTLAGCSLGLEDLPAPAGTSGATYGVTAEFADVQNLAIGATVKLGGVVVGEVADIRTRDYHAYVDLSLENKVPLGKDAQFQIRFTTPLGEDFVSVRSKGNTAKGVLANGDNVAIVATGTAPSIEDTFSALSTLLNGGGLSKLQTIATELDTAFKGRTSNARRALVNMDRIIANLDDHKTDIDKTLNGLAAMATELNKGTGVVEQALDLFPPTFDVLAGQTRQLRELLTKVGTLGTTVNGLLVRSQSNMLAVFDKLRPTLDSLRARQNELIPTFTALTKLGTSLRRAAPGDYLNASITVEFLLEAPPFQPQKGGSIHPEGSSTSDAIRHLLGGNPGGGS